jgi:hypothetical protein
VREVEPAEPDQAQASAVALAPVAPALTPQAASVLALQRSAGNAAVCKMLARSPILRPDGHFFTSQLCMEPRAFVNAWLEFYGFGIPPVRNSQRPILINGTARSMDDVIDHIVEDGNRTGSPITRDEAGKELLQQYMQARGDATSVHFTLSYTFVPAAYHAANDGSSSVDPPASQVAGQLTVQLHRDDEPGFEVSFSGQVTLFHDSTDPNTWRVGGLAAQAQGAYVIPFMLGNQVFQFSAAVQVMGGAARNNHMIDGQMRTTWDAQTGAAGQAQLLWQINKRFQVGIVGSAGGTFTQIPHGANDPYRTGDIAGGVVFQMTLP